ncbi:MAG: glycine--tRNA ligase [Candidatus Aenigmatarchaeota archaeon]|nr:glycine--tRNA ligase [Candidatus Aenigmarchaeota archaeon]
MVKLEDIQRLCLTRGIIYPTAEIYGGLSGTFDYGPVGVLIKRKFIEYWRDFFVKSMDCIVEVDGATILPEKVLIASGHVESFVDPITQCEKCKSIYRADNFIEERTGKFVEGKSTKELTEIIVQEKLSCPNCKGKLSEVKMFNLMFKTFAGPTGEQIAYLRPESAQNIFTSFERVFRSSRAKLPFGIAQHGHAFRNEISARQFVIRSREFNQIEIEMFFDPENDDFEEFQSIANKEIILVTREAQLKKTDAVRIKIKDAVNKKIIPNKWMGFFLAKEFEFFKSLGIPESALRFRHMLPEETPHYSGGNFDLEIKFDFGWKETVGNAYRTDHDLKNHSKFSGEDLAVSLPDGRKILPHVVEPSFGLERILYAILLYNFVEDKERGWNWLRLPPKIAPYIAGVYPLVNKDGINEKAKEIFKTLKKNFDVLFDDAGSIGKRYARADEIGIPFGITIDYQTLEDDTVTIRDRDSTKQERIKISEIESFIKNKLIL